MCINSFGESIRPHVDFIQHIDQLTTPSNIVLLCRESYTTQKANGNLDDQVRDSAHQIESRGHNIVFTHAFVGSGKRPWESIYPAIEAAWKYKAVIVAETIDRLMRPEDYHSQNKPKAQLTKTNLRTLKSLLCEIPTYTLQNPNSSPGENRGTQTKRGMRQKNKKGGNYYKGTKSFRKRWLSVVLELHQQGKSSRQIAAEIEKQSGKKVTHRTILKWTKSTNSLDTFS